MMRFIEPVLFLAVLVFAGLIARQGYRYFTARGTTQLWATNTKIVEDEVYRTCPDHGTYSAADAVLVEGTAGCPDCYRNRLRTPRRPNTKPEATS